MLAELSVVEQRYLAVREVLEAGAKITDVAIRYGVDRRNVHRWLVRWEQNRLGPSSCSMSQTNTSRRSERAERASGLDAVAFGSPTDTKSRSLGADLPGNRHAFPPPARDDDVI